jgi:hypothetical protein
MNGYPVFRCAICDEELQEDPKIMICSTCRKTEQAEWSCINGHYVCEECRIASPVEIIEKICKTTPSENPIAIANLIMRQTTFNSHGPEHHMLVAPVVIAALANSTGISIDKTRIRSLMKRTEDIPIGVCTSRGDCGACVGAGAALSFICRTIDPTVDLRGLALKTTAKALLYLSGMRGRRCCKQSVYAAIETCARVLNEELKAKLHTPSTKITCEFSRKIADCKKENCPYYDA